MNLLKKLITLSFLMLMGLTQVYAQMAILCISPISKTAVVDEMSGAPREQWGKPLPTYSVQVDHSAIIKVDHKTPIKLKLANTSGKHQIKIYANGVLETSFYYYPTVIDVLRLSESGYQTWDWVKFKTTRSALKYCNTQNPK